MHIPEDIIEKVRENNDIVDVISEYVSLNRRGKNYVGLCPFHNEKTPSFSVTQDKQIYRCFGCGEGGNVISFIMKYRNMNFIEAVKLLAERANIALPDTNGNVDNKTLKIKQNLYKLNREAAIFFYHNLQKNKSAYEYLKKRGISDDIIKRFGLGFAPDSWDSLQKYLLSKAYTTDLMEKAGLIIKREKGSGYYDRFRNRVMFPVFDISNRIIGFGGRVTDDSKPKYLNSPETLVFSKGNNLYGLNLVVKNNNNRKIMIVEGYMDVIALHQHDIKIAVASLGTAMTRDQARLMKRYADEIIICYDSDNAGQTATLRGLDILSEIGCNVSILTVPKGKDPDEFIRNNGRDEFLKIMKETTPLIEYKLRRKSEGFDTATTEGKIGFIKACAQVLRDINDKVVVDAYVNKLSSETGISQSALYDEIAVMGNLQDKSKEETERHINGKYRYNNSDDRQKLYLKPAYLKAEKSILQYLFQNRDYFKFIEKNLDCNLFSDDVYRKIACVVFENLKRGEKINPSAVVSMFDTSEDMKKAVEVFDTSEIQGLEISEKVINDLIRLINSKAKFLNEKEALNKKMLECERTGDSEQSALLLKRIIDIEKQLRMM